MLRSLSREQLSAAIRFEALPAAAVVLAVPVLLPLSDAPDPYQFFLGVGVAVAVLSVVDRVDVSLLLGTLGAAGVLAAIWGFVGWELATWRLAALAVAGTGLIALSRAVGTDDA